MRLRSSGLLLLLALAACNNNGLDVGGDGGSGDGDTAARPDLTSPPPTPDLSLLPDLTPAMNGTGNACTGGGFPPKKGTCDTGEICLPDMFGFVGGYCSQQCSRNNPCPDGASCQVIAQAGISLCFKNCTSDNDCRAPDYSCLPGKNVCGFDGLFQTDGVPAGTNDGGACVQPAVTPQQMPGLFGANVQVSGNGNVKSLAAECTLSVDPMNKNVVVSYIDLMGGTINVTHSGDDGATWAQEIKLPENKLVDANRDQSDPVATVDNLGNFWIVWIGFDRSGMNPNPTNMAVYVAKSSDGGATFPDLFLVSPKGEWVAGGALDKPWIFASPADGSIYVSWNQQPGQNSDLNMRLTRTVDYGKTWSAPVNVNDAGARGGVDRNLAQIAVGADSRPAVAWVEVNGQTMGAQFGDVRNRVYVQRFNADFTRSGSNVWVSRGDSPAFDDPSVAISGNDVYVGYISGDPSGKWDVRVAASIDAAVTFQAPVKVNDDVSCATHFHHQLTVDKNGGVHAIWFDNRYGAGNVFHAESVKAGMGAPLAFGTNTFVNDVPFEFTAGRSMADWLGDYLDFRIVGNEMYAAWTDNRTTTSSRIFFAKGALK